jgi:hypothetical protein
MRRRLQGGSGPGEEAGRPRLSTRSGSRPGMARRSGTGYHVTVTFRAPTEFVFRWCTDYDAGDAALEGETFERRVLSRTARRVVFEDLGRAEDGWVWRHYAVDLHPPRRWHAESVGNRRNLTLDYELTEAGDGRTRLDLRWRRTPGILPRTPPPKATVERDSTAAWRRLGRSLERDYRRTARSEPRARPGP